MKNIIGGIEFPPEIKVRNANRYKRICNDGSMRKLIGWEFINPVMSEIETVIIENKSIEEAALCAYNLFKKRGYIE